MKRLFSLSICLLALATAMAFAGVITVNNPDFEVTTGASGSTWTGTPAYYMPGGLFNGWTYLGQSGIMQPGTVPNSLFNTVAPVQPPDTTSLTFGYAGSTIGTGDIEQAVGTVASAGDVYLLSVEVGKRIGYSVGTISLLINGNSVSGTPSACAPTSGNWAVCTYEYVTTASDVGKTVTIDLHGASGSGAQASFDDVSLQDGVPEPGTFALLGFGFLAIVKLARRQK